MAQLSEARAAGQTGHIADTNALHRKANYVFDVVDFGAVGDGVTDDTAAIQAAIDAADAATGMIYFPAGVYRLITGLTTSTLTDVMLLGAGTSSIISPDAGVTALTISGTRVRISGLQFQGGAIGVSVTSGVDCMFDNLHFTGQTSNGVLVDGEGSTEQHWVDITMRDVGGVAFKYTRTSQTDTGGMYLTRVRVVAPAASPTHAFLFTSTDASVTPIFLFMDNCVADNYPVSAVKFLNTARVNIKGCFFSCNSSAGNNTGALHIDNGFLFQIDNTYFNHSRTTATGFGILLEGSSHEILMSNVLFDGANAVNALGVNDAGENVVLGVHFSYTGTLSDTPANLVTGAGLTFMPPGTFWTRSDGGVNDVLAFKNATTPADAAKYFRTSGGNLEILNGAFSTSIFTLTDGGQLLLSGSWIRNGTGTPESAITGNVGDLFRRTDGGAGTTLYVKESGTGNTGWVAK